MIIKFENTNVRTEIYRHYSIEGAPVLDSPGLYITTPVIPTIAKFIFVDGDFFDVELYGRPVKKDGQPSERVIRVRDIYPWNQGVWPDWLKRLRDLAFSEFAGRVEG